ncbi:hypothetical protein [Stenotrophomonas lactitubi]|uniref:hypothetical protein n=1 Tax=Stenotrophomonas lactitubi TaxID=2045214 RepID=UPI00333FF9B2
MALEFGECLSMKVECATFWAGWGALATGAVGLVTVVVAFLAWRTSRQAAAIAAKQHLDSQVLWKAQARIVGRLLLHEVTAVPKKIEYYASELDALPTLDPSTVKDWRAVKNAVERLADPLLPSAEASAEQIHYLPVDLGADLATMISHSRDINAAACHIAAHIHEYKPIPGIMATRISTTYTGRPMALQALRRQLQFVASVAPDLVERFRREVLSERERAERKESTPAV